MGVACSCDWETTVLCVFFFAKGLIAKENTVNLPIYLNFTDYYSCYWDYYYYDVYDITCEAPYVSTFESCIYCDEIIPDCYSCSYKKNGTLSIECYDCWSGYLISLSNGISVCDYCSGSIDTVTGRCLDSISCNSDQYVDPNSNTCIDCSYLNSECYSCDYNYDLYMADCSDCGSLTVDTDFGGCIDGDSSCPSGFYNPYPVDQCTLCSSLDPYAVSCQNGLITSCGARAVSGDETFCMSAGTDCLTTLDSGLCESCSSDRFLDLVSGNCLLCST